MTDGSVTDELLTLLGAMRDEQITPEQIAHLERIISQDDEARRIHVRFMLIHGLLEQAAVAMDSDQAALRLERPAGAGGRPWPRRLWSMAAAASVLIAVSVWWMATRSGKEDDERIASVPIWKVTPGVNARFERLTPTSLRLQDGELRIEAVKTDRGAPLAAAELALMTIATPAGKVTLDGSDFLVGTHESSDPEKHGEAAMKQITRVLVLAGAATLMNAHGSVTGEADNLLAAQADQAPVKQVVEGNTGFAIDMYRQLLKQKSGPNLFFSPYSISLALTMTAEGARGATAEQIGKVLHFPSTARRIGDDAQLIPWRTALIHTGLARLNRDLAGTPKKQSDRHELRIANGLWGEQSYPFRQQFVETLKGAYDIGAAQPCDFVGNADAERQRINGWVADQTSKRIKDLLPPGSVNRGTRLVLANAIYFKADWVQKFDKRSTKPAEFFTLAGGRVKTPMMSGAFKQVKFAYIGAGDPHQSLRAGKADNFRLVELPYKGGLSMVLMAPDNVRGLPKLESQLTTDSLAKWLSRLRPADKVEIALPRFKFLTEYRLMDALKQLGMTRAFMPPGPEGADFSGMVQSGNRELSIGGVYHKAFVAVNEEGTEAAAATGVTGLLGAPPPPPPQFVGNRPFLFLIRDPASGTILFMGRITDPTGVANNDRSERQEAAFQLARTTPAKHPLYQHLKDAAGVAIIRTYRPPTGGIEFKADNRGRTMRQCRIDLSLKGELKAESLPWLVIEQEAAISETGQAFGDFFSESYGQVPVLAVYQRQGSQFVVQELIEIDEVARLIVSSLYSIPAERLSKIIDAGKAKR
ncbi:MAG: hypothetical protein FJ271_23355 [Planctomycetes bacterium]|nr:hypothetical protein [Planctomycetota bacterium]